MGQRTNSVAAPRLIVYRVGHVCHGIALVRLRHKRLTWYHNGLDRRLTDVHGNLLKGILS